MTDLRNQRLGISFFNKIEKLAAEMGADRVEEIFDDMLITYAKVDEVFPDREDRQQKLDELFKLHEEITTQQTVIQTDMANAGYPISVTTHGYLEQSLELYRYAASAALEGKRLGFMEDLPEEGIALLPPSLDVVYEDVLDDRSETLSSRVSIQGTIVAANANTATEPA